MRTFKNNNNKVEKSKKNIKLMVEKLSKNFQKNF